MKTQEVTLEALKAQIAEIEKAKKAESEKVKREKVGSCSYDLRTAFVDKFPQGLRDRKSFTLNIVKINVTQANVANLIDWLRKNDREDRANEIEANKARIFDITIVADDGSVELFNSGILAFDKKNSLNKLVVKSKDGYDYYVSRMCWDADNKDLLFT